jgi:hypothetical protein
VKSEVIIMNVTLTKFFNTALMEYLKASLLPPYYTGGTDEGILGKTCPLDDVIQIRRFTAEYCKTTSHKKSPKIRN